jgi:tetratricopeptide (TPR) repeat protein
LNQQQQKFFLSKWTSSIPALQLYLQGRRIYYHHSREELQESIRLYDLAISNDRKFATAYSARALAYLDLAKSGTDQINNFQKAEASALKAIELEVRQSEAHAVLGAVNLLYRWNFQIAEENLKNALVLNPNSSLARSYLAFLLTARRQPEAALKEMVAAQKRDPLSETMQLEFIQLLTKLKKYDQAIELAQANMDKFDPITVNLLLGDAYLGKKETDAALLSYRRSKDLGSNDAVAKIATVLADSGMNREAVTLLENLINRSPDNVNPDLVAAAYARIGDPAKALEWLRKSSLVRPSSLVLLSVDPAFDSLRNDPHFNQFLLKSGL